MVGFQSLILLRKGPVAIFQYIRHSLSLAKCHVSKLRNTKLNIKTIREKPNERGTWSSGSFTIDRRGKDKVICRSWIFKF